MARNYAALFYEYGEEMDALSDAEFGRLCRALIEYAKSGTPIALCGNERFYAKRVMMMEDRIRQSYRDLSEERSEAGKKGAESRWSKANDSKEWQPMANDSNGMAKMGNTNTNTNTNTTSSYEDDLRAVSEDIITAWNGLGLSQVTRIMPNSQRYTMLNARIREYGKDEILKAIENIKGSSFLRGQNQRSWIITFDWFLKPNNFVKVRDGNYTDAKPEKLAKNSPEYFGKGAPNAEDVRNAYAEMLKWEQTSGNMRNEQEEGA